MFSSISVFPLTPTTARRPTLVFMPSAKPGTPAAAPLAAPAAFAQDSIIEPTAARKIDEIGISPNTCGFLMDWLKPWTSFAGKVGNG